MWVHFSDTAPRARHGHTCMLCGLPIKKGDVHVARRGASDGTAVTMRMHQVCEKLTHDWDEDDWNGSDNVHEFRRVYLNHNH